MDLKHRVENSLTGFLLLDLFRLRAQVFCKKKRLPLNAAFLHKDTLENLQNVALGTISVGITKDPEGNPCQEGHLRMTDRY